MLEVKLLSSLGFRLSLDECVATGTCEDLEYVSPKSGCAVSKQAGEPYKDKLFKLPLFLKNNFTEYNDEELKTSDIKESLRMTLYFLEKYVFLQNDIKLPESRKNLQEAL
jgi:DNA repair protein RecO (recombination protein O)